MPHKDNYPSQLKNTPLKLTVIIAASLLLLSLKVIWGDVGIHIAALLVSLATLWLLYYNRRLVKALADKQRGYEDLLCNITGGLVVTQRSPNSDDIIIVFASEGFSVLTGYTSSELETQLGGRFIELVHPEDRHLLCKPTPEADRIEGNYAIQYRIVCRNGEEVWVHDRGRYSTDANGVRQTQGVLTDVSDIRQAQEELRHSEELLRLTFACTDNMIFEYDIRSRTYIELLNGHKLIGKTCDRVNWELDGIDKLEEQAANRRVAENLFYSEDVDKFITAMVLAYERGESSCVGRLNTSSGDYVWCRVLTIILRDNSGLPVRALGFVDNIDVYKRQADSLKRRSEKDLLTGFYNKPTATALIDEVLSRSFTDDNVLFALDIDNFKGINDTLGHIAGDAVLAEAAERIRGVFRSDDILGRVGGDEFVILARGLIGHENIVRKARDIVEAFRIMSVNAGGVLNISVSIGIELPPPYPSSYDEVFPHADLALYEAKRNGKGCYAFYSPIAQNNSTTPI